MSEMAKETEIHSKSIQHRMVAEISAKGKIQQSEQNCQKVGNART